MEHHPLEFSQVEREYFEQCGTKGFSALRGSYRRAIEALAGSLPTWAERAKLGPKPRQTSKAL